MKASRLAAALAGLLMLTCASNPPRPPDPDPLRWRSGKTPGWVNTAAVHGKGGTHFVGVSYKYAEEKDARQDAEREAFAQAARNVSMAVQDVFERLWASLNLSDKVQNPSTVARDYEKFVSQVALRNTETDAFYLEQREKRDTREVYFKAFARLWVPTDAVVGNFSDYMSQKQKEWDLTQEQLDRVSRSFNDYWESKQQEKKPKE
jgi:hypothetical protein